MSRAQGMASRLRRDDEHRRRSFAPETSRFFKIILSPSLQAGRLGIPKKFARKYGKNLVEAVSLRVSNGGSWRVELEKSDDVVWLSKGWKEFMEHYSIREGHFLVFKYVGDLDFHVLIFDKSTTEIDYPLSNLDNVEFVPPKMEDADDDHCNLPVGHKSSDGFWPKRKEKEGFRTDQGVKLMPHDSEGRMESSKGKVSPDMLASRSSTFTRSRVSTALEAANKHEPQYPSFTAVIRSRNLLKCDVVRNDPEIMAVCKNLAGNGIYYLLTVPGRFFKGRINERTQLATLKYSDRSWPVKLLYYPRHSSGKLSAGFSAFQRGTSLKEGDVCVFELVGTDNVVLKVSIFRKNVET